MIADDHFLWVERYRPKTVKDCILPDDLKKSFQAYVDSGTIPNLILKGTPGTGKTTIARAMCEEVGADYILINGSDERGVDTLRTTIKGFGSTVSLTGARKVIIMDEADNITHDAQKAFRGVIEEFAGGCSFIFTCNDVSRIIEPLHSRFAIIPFIIAEKDKAKMAGDFYKRVIQILNTEEIKYDKSAVAEVVKKYFPDYRRTLNELQHYSVGGKVDIGILSKVSDATYSEIFSLIKAKNFPALRKWVGTNSDGETSVIMRGIYDRLSEHLAPDSIPVAIILLGKYQYQAAYAVDKEINLMAFLTELLVECQVK
jgi:DNA polymerase III delta prime subunit